MACGLGYQVSYIVSSIYIYTGRFIDFYFLFFVANRSEYSSRTKVFRANFSFVMETACTPRSGSILYVIYKQLRKKKKEKKL